MILACLYKFLPLLKWTYKEIHRNNALQHHIWLVYCVDTALKASVSHEVVHAILHQMEHKQADI